MAGIWAPDIYSAGARSASAAASIPVFVHQCRDRPDNSQDMRLRRALIAVAVTTACSCAGEVDQGGSGGTEAARPERARQAARARATGPRAQPAGCRARAGRPAHVATGGAGTTGGAGATGGAGTGGSAGGAGAAGRGGAGGGSGTGGRGGTGGAATGGRGGARWNRRRGGERRRPGRPRWNRRNSRNGWNRNRRDGRRPDAAHPDLDAQHPPQRRHRQRPPDRGRARDRARRPGDRRLDGRARRRASARFRSRPTAA